MLSGYVLENQCIKIIEGKLVVIASHTSVSITREIPTIQINDRREQGFEYQENTSRTPTNGMIAMI